MNAAEYQVIAKTARKPYRNEMLGLTNVSFEDHDNASYLGDFAIHDMSLFETGTCKTTQGNKCEVREVRNNDKIFVYKLYKSVIVRFEIANANITIFTR